MNNNKPRKPADVVAIFLLSTLFARQATAAIWQLSAGATRYEGGAVELSGRSHDWEVALGYVTEQTVLINYITPSCPYEGAPRYSCTADVTRRYGSVDSYGYLSVQRRFEFRRGAPLRPLAGLGLVAQSDMNPYVSTPVNLSLSLGLAVGERLSVEWRHFSNADTGGENLGQDCVLLRWQLP